MSNSEYSHSFSSWRNCFFPSRFVFALPLSQLWKSLVICLFEIVTHRVATISLWILARSVPIEDSTCPASPRLGSTVSIARCDTHVLVCARKYQGWASPSKSEICDQNPSADGSSQERSTMELGRTRRTSDEYPPLTGPRHGDHCQFCHRWPAQPSRHGHYPPHACTNHASLAMTRSRSLNKAVHVPISMKALSG